MKFLLRPIYVPYRFFSNVRYWALRRFTRVGLTVIASVLAAGLMGFDTDNSVAYQAFTIMLFLLLVAVSCSMIFRGRFSVRRILPRFGTVGSTLRYTVEVANLTPRSQAGLTFLENLEDPRPQFQDWVAKQLDDARHLKPFRLTGRRANPFKIALAGEAEVPPIPPHQVAEAPMELLPVRRGVLRFKGATIARADPLGLFRAFRKIKSPDTVLILPKRYYIPPVALPGISKYQQGGVAQASNVGQSDEFVSLRDYRQGDPPRHIHWRSWAKMGHPITKEFEDEFFVRHALVLDTFTNRVHGEAFEEAVSVAASFACTVLTQESLLDLLFIGPEAYCFTAGRGLAQSDHMLEILASVRPCRNPSFDSLEHLVLNHASSVSGCILVLLAWDDERQQLVKKLKLLGVPLLVLVIRAENDSRPLPPGPMGDEPDCLRSLQIGRIKEQLSTMT